MSSVFYQEKQSEIDFARKLSSFLPWDFRLFFFRFYEAHEGEVINPAVAEINQEICSLTADSLTLVLFFLSVPSLINLFYFSNKRPDLFFVPI